eukprot:CAMPEP_0194583484 /NCGR_PEP_ID=MMETSP0292-20121207/16364_1 /TAXON_ID=39354 /ORGANISM="Heterosigma akashiwo, Strain CCMP2393" /LENGTH=153 /DNA_ID=CAMNT_0039438109 /DNA_START=495 /DNA_END=956 /DNA_ORIENTATION=-
MPLCHKYSKTPPLSRSFGNIAFFGRGGPPPSAPAGASAGAPGRRPPARTPPRSPAGPPGAPPPRAAPAAGGGGAGGARGVAGRRRAHGAQPQGGRYGDSASNVINQHSCMAQRAVDIHGHNLLRHHLGRCPPQDAVKPPGGIQPPEEKPAQKV